ncbi:MAG: OmpA family protein [Candidatus Solibacter usitatus]|nr:OmpA family protein [Candidatus Solibacter usitatus]
MAEQESAPIIVIKKKKGHGGHHGGAWKVAYADFVTAMMALFIVLWLLSSSEKVKKAVGGYFTDPSGAGKMTGSTLAGSGEGINLKEDDMTKLKEKLEQAMKEIPRFQEMKDQIHITVTGEGLRVELLETKAGMFFDSGRPHPSEQGKVLLAKLASELGKLPNSILMEGHTDAKPFAGEGAYSNWELSADRANAARRFMETAGFRPGQVVQVRGFADRALLKKGDPEHPSNRRISVIVQYLHPPPAATAKAPAQAEPGKTPPPAKAEHAKPVAKSGH